LGSNAPAAGPEDGFSWAGPGHHHRGKQVSPASTAEFYAMSTDADIDPRMTPVIVHRILVVEDDPETAAFLKTLLEREKYDVTVAKEGGQAHSMFVMKKPDFVILDLILPGESGFEVCERLKTMERYVPVLILTRLSSMIPRTSRPASAPTPT